MSMSSFDQPTPDSAMASGSPPCAPADEPDAMERDPGHGDSPEVTAAALRAAMNDGPLPAAGGVPDDGLTPSFRAPETD